MSTHQFRFWLLVQPSLFYLGFRTWKLALFSIFQTVRDVLPKAQSWSQFRGLNTKEKTSCPACGCVQMGSVVSQFLHDTVMVTVTELSCLNKHNWNIGGTQRKVVYCFQWLTTLLWCGLVERNKNPNKDHHHLMSEMCSPAVLFLENRISRLWQLQYMYLVVNALFYIKKPALSCANSHIIKR